MWDQSLMNFESIPSSLVADFVLKITDPATYIIMVWFYFSIIYFQIEGSLASLDLSLLGRHIFCWCVIFFKTFVVVIL